MQSNCVFKILSVSQVVLSSRRPVDIYWRLPGLSTQELHQEDLGALLTDKFRLEQVEPQSLKLVCSPVFLKLSP